MEGNGVNCCVPIISILSKEPNCIYPKCLLQKQFNIWQTTATRRYWYYITYILEANTVPAYWKEKYLPRFLASLLKHFELVCTKHVV